RKTSRMLRIDESFGERRASQVRRQGNGKLQPLDSLRGDVRDHTVQKDSTHAVYIEGSSKAHVLVGGARFELNGKGGRQGLMRPEPAHAPERNLVRAPSEDGARTVDAGFPHFSRCDEGPHGPLGELHRRVGTEHDVT